MAMLFMDSFDHYTIASDKWSDQRNLAGTTLQTLPGRFGTGWNANSGRYLTKLLGANYTTLITGFAFQPYGPTTTDNGVCAFYDGSNLQVELTYDGGTGTWTVIRNLTSIGSVVSAIPLGAFSYVEIMVTFDNSAGAVTLKVDETTILTLTSTDTQFTANAYANMFRLGDTFDGQPNFVYDDFYLLDTSGSAPNNTFWGDTRIQALYPSGNGNSSQFVGSDSNSTDNYLLVDEATPNGDTDYVESLNLGDKDTYAFTNLTPTSGTVYGVQALPYARKTDAGTRSIVSVARLSGTETDSAVSTLTTSYGYLPDIRETKPGGGAWTIGDVNNAEFGMKVNS